MNIYKLMDNTAACLVSFHKPGHTCEAVLVVTLNLVCYEENTNDVCDITVVLNTCSVSDKVLQWLDLQKPTSVAYLP